MAIAEPRSVQVIRTRSDRIYRAVARSAGVVTLAILVLIGAFLLIRAWPTLATERLDFLTGFEWVDSGDKSVFGIGAILYWTVVIAVIALGVAVPVAICAALFITEYAPLRLRKLFTSLVDLLAAVPSLIYGIWGFFFLQPRLLGVARWLSSQLEMIPIFKVDRPIFASSAFIAGVVVSLMVIPIATSVMREVFSQSPPGEKEAALALGSTKWGMIRTVVLPFGRGGIIGGSMLGLGRALGETIAVAIIISPIFIVSPRILESGANSVASHIALRFGDASTQGLSALMAAGLALFVLTLLVNMLASMIVARSRSGKGVEI